MGRKRETVAVFQKDVPEERYQKIERECVCLLKELLSLTTCDPMEDFESGATQRVFLGDH